MRVRERDFLSFVRSIGALEEFCKDDETKLKLRMLLTDDEENDVDCVLFDDVASDAFMAQLQNTETPVVIVLNLARIVYSKDGVPTIYNSFNATRAAFNPPMKEVKQFIESAKHGFSPVLTSLSEQVPSQSTQLSISASLHSQTKISISQITEKDIGACFVIHCEILKLETRYGWKYDGCSKCGTKATCENSVLVCPSCTRKSQSKIEPKLKLHYVMKNKTGSVSVIFWDKLAVQLIHKTAVELKLILQNEKCDYDFPDELDNPVGKKLLLKLKMDKYNKKHPNSSISVGQFTICEDLMDQFNQAIIEALPTQGLDDVDPAILDNRSKYIFEQQEIAQTIVPTKPEINEDTQDAILANVINNLPAAPIKGKRKASVKKNAIRDAPAHAPQVPPVIPIDDRLTKVIKQEK